jgi:hypothetical protein
VPDRVLEVLDVDLDRRERVPLGREPEPGVFAKYAAVVGPASTGAGTAVAPPATRAGAGTVR